MHIRKILSTLLLMTLLAGVMLAAGCQSGTPTNAPAEKVKVGVLYISPIDDGGWSTAHNRGFVMAENEIGKDKIEWVTKENIPDTDAAATETALRIMADAGCQIIFATSYNYMDTVEKLAKEYPEIKFEHCSGYKTADNMDNYFGQIEQPRFLSGIVAGLTTKSNKIGYVAAIPIPEVVRGINAFTLGVRSVNPDAEVHVRWTNTWFDLSLESAAANELLNLGCDVTSQHQDSAATLKAAEAKGVFGIGYDNPMGDAAPKAYLTAPIWNWGAYYTKKIKAVMDGTWSVEQYWGGMKEGMVGLDTLTDLVPQAAKEKVAEIEPMILEQGNDYVFKGPIKDNQGNEKVAAGTSLSKADQMGMDWFVEGVVGSVG